MQTLPEPKLATQVKFELSNYLCLMVTMIEFSWSHVKEIPNTNLLVSLHHNEDKAAKLEIFDISKKDRTNIICSFEEVKGGIFIYFKIILRIVFASSYW